MLATRYPLLATLLRRYFYSGWAFLIPYLAAYLLYYVTGWPVNPPIDVGSTAHSPSPLAPPPLIHLYWALHALHLILAALALRSWWTENSAQYGRNASDSQSAPYSSYRLHLLTRIAPWAILALIFYIPGVYLEWPSDPWEHLRRINEWRILDTVGAHSSWRKSSYFIPYSFLNWCTGLRQLFWLDFYYTGICLLLCWQYYRFSRACGLGERASMVFVIVQALLLGNNIFSFYRYYGISSSIYAQLGAIALTRIVLVWATHGTKLAATLQETTATGDDTGTPLALGTPPSPRPSRLSPVDSSVYSLLAIRYSLLTFSSRPSFWHFPAVVRLSSIAFCLLLLIAFNHVQGIGIAGLGVAAVITWRLIEWKRSALWWLTGGTILINALFLLLYPRSPIIETYRAQGWLNAWDGFNIFNPTSPAADRMLQIITGCGLFNIIAAFVLFRRKSVVAWLTVMPFIGLSTPVFAVLFGARVFTAGGESNIITFQRMLLGIPLYLALVQLASRIHCEKKEGEHLPMPVNRICVAALLGVYILISIPSDFPWYNRFWASITTPPSDLRLRDIYSQPHTHNSSAIFPAAIGPSGILAAVTPKTVVPYTPEFRPIGWSTTSFLNAIIELLTISDERRPQQSNAISYSVKEDHDKTFAPTMNNSTEPNTSILVPRLIRSNEWTSVGGSAPTFPKIDSTQFPPATVLQNPPGLPCYALNSTSVPIDRFRSYNLEITIRDANPCGAITYLAVAWYDKEGNLLEASSPLPKGAGNPHGWANNTFSHFGLIAQPAPAKWTTYAIAFGWGEKAMIPINAHFVRIGALLNCNAKPTATLQVFNMELRETPWKSIGLYNPRMTSIFSATSQAAQLSNHWPTQQMAVSRAGVYEIERSAVLLNAMRRQPAITLIHSEIHSWSPHPLH
jgi:hypothetical protein